MPPWYENGIVPRVRMDEWLWAARFFKTRALARRACELGRIEANGQGAKASREVRAGGVLQVKNDGCDFQVVVLVLSEMRGPAAVAQTLYRTRTAQKLLSLRRFLVVERAARPAMPSASPAESADMTVGVARKTARSTGLAAALRRAGSFG